MVPQRTIKNFPLYFLSVGLIPHLRMREGSSHKLGVRALAFVLLLAKPLQQHIMVCGEGIMSCGLVGSFGA